MDPKHISEVLPEIMEDIKTGRGFWATVDGADDVAWPPLQCDDANQNVEGELK